MFAGNDVQTASFDVEMKEQTFSVLIPPIGSLPSEGDMFYGFVVATSAFLCFGFGNYIIKNRWLKAAALCMGWVFMVFAHAEIQRIISVYCFFNLALFLSFDCRSGCLYLFVP